MKRKVKNKLLNKKVVQYFLALLGAGVLLLMAVFGIDYHVKTTGEKGIITEISDVPKTQAVLVLGAKVYSGGQLSPALKYRVDAALELYNLEKVEKFLLSGDHGKNDYDEVNAMKDYLLSKGVPPEDIFMDHAGFETYDSVYRAKAIFEIRSMTIVTQEFHLRRALYIAKKLDLEAYGIEAKDWENMPLTSLNLREIPARDKAFFYLLINKKPKYLGEVIPITGESKKSWD